MSGAIAVEIVAARSAAEMPVLVRPRASIETHIAVSRSDELTETSSGISSVSSRSGDHRQADQAAAVRRHEVDQRQA